MSRGPAYIVQPGDSPARIAIAKAGCPKCAIDLVHANPHKDAVVLPNGFKTFRSLHAGEVLNLPEKWSNGELDTRPRSYFAALPHPDGVTRSTLGDAASGVLGDYATLDAASAKVGALTTLGDQQFSDSVNDTAATIDASVQDTGGSGAPAMYAATYAQDVRKSTAHARQRGTDLVAAIKAGDQNASFTARNDILHDFSDALLSARLALQAFYGDQSPVTTGFSAALKTAAQAVVAAIASDPSYCASVAHTGTAVNSVVHAFKTAWNASQAASIPINTGNYEQATAEAIAQVLGGAPVPCAVHASPAPVQPTPVVATTPRSAPLSTGSIVGISLLGASAIGGAVYLSTRKKKHRRR